VCVCVPAPPRTRVCAYIRFMYLRDFGFVFVTARSPLLLRRARAVRRTILVGEVRVVFAAVSVRFRFRARMSCPARRTRLLRYQFENYGGFEYGGRRERG